MKILEKTTCKQLDAFIQIILELYTELQKIKQVLSELYAQTVYARALQYLLQRTHEHKLKELLLYAYSRGEEEAGVLLYYETTGELSRERTVKHVLRLLEHYAKEVGADFEEYRQKLDYYLEALPSNNFRSVASTISPRQVKQLCTAVKVAGSLKESIKRLLAYLPCPDLRELDKLLCARIKDAKLLEEIEYLLYLRENLPRQKCSSFARRLLKEQKYRELMLLDQWSKEFRQKPYVREFLDSLYSFFQAAFIILETVRSLSFSIYSSAALCELAGKLTKLEQRLKKIKKLASNFLPKQVVEVAWKAAKEKAKL
ncbi:MAG: hypothetical protein GXO42_00850 [bacterium]|nr:hypothetical protein [bacterium]